MIIQVMVEFYFRDNDHPNNGTSFYKHKVTGLKSF